MLCEESTSFSLDNSNSSQSSDSSIIDQSIPLPTYEDIAITKMLNKAKFPVFLGFSPSNNENFAVKFFPFSSGQVNRCFVNEILFANLRHENVISILHYENNREAAFQDGVQNISYTVMELAPYGDFFDVVMSQKIFKEEKLIRTYFHQLIEGLEYLHSMGVAHLDLKLDNLLLGRNFSLKIGDFDQAYMKGQRGIISKGTMSYRAPELANRTCKNPEAADVYSAGIILFLLKCKGTLPYSEKEKFKGLDMFELMVRHPRLFWEKHCEIQKQKSSFFDEDFKALFNATVKVNPEERPTIQQIKSSKWYNGPTYTQKELEIVMKAYF